MSVPRISSLSAMILRACDALCAYIRTQMHAYTYIHTYIQMTKTLHCECTYVYACIHTLLHADTSNTCSLNMTKSANLDAVCTRHQRHSRCMCSARRLAGWRRVDLKLWGAFTWSSSSTSGLSVLTNNERALISCVSSDVSPCQGYVCNSRLYAPAVTSRWPSATQPRGPCGATTSGWSFATCSRTLLLQASCSEEHSVCW
jgi:hypothetical protein